MQTRKENEQNKQTLCTIAYSLCLYLEPIHVGRSDFLMTSIEYTMLGLFSTLYILLLYTVAHFQSHMNVFVKGFHRCCVEVLQHGNAHLANNVVDNFCG